ncbi:alkaline phosphatase family protein [Lutimonas saemankumensis]|uniref:alkaline phosphatase PafA n=1 Tax=Lutimonas saemankumensis TaxID=483016 RepID=UPI001CD29608|nr:alkaline phosphatase PafA [Lutimonas saemankumensis]MCA0933858.1 alkaline phosphatase family protein [Lutimonas saemankumensis]
MKRIFLFTCLFLMFMPVMAQETTKVDRPKLVVGIIVDQMRYDFLTRFYHRYGEDGFKRLLKEGYNFENAHFNYVPTVTAVGHASVYTGTSGSGHGIIANDWYDKFQRKMIYCVDDLNFKALGTELEYEQKAPTRLLATTLTDELRLSQNMRGRTIAMGLKDRSAVLPGGHTSNGSYWFVGKDEGKFITSTFYMDELPKWVNDFNKSGIAEKVFKNEWETLYPISSYDESIDDDNPYEGLFYGEEKPVFPHKLKTLRKDNGNFDLLKETPYGNTLLIEFAKSAIKGEKLGKGDFTDFLAISFSSPDYIGHMYGPDSKEIEDTYLRLDKDIAELLNYLDKHIGNENYTLFLTADHAVLPVPAYLSSLKIPAGYFDYPKFRSFIDELTNSFYGANNLVENISNNQIFFDKTRLSELGLSASEVAERLCEEIIDYPGVNKVVSAKTLQNTNFDRGILHHVQNGYNQKLSGDIVMVPNPATIYVRETGTTHGSGYSYDTHVPIIFFGKGIKKGRSRERAEIIDIAPTMSNLLQISFPNSYTGRVLSEALK